MLSTLTNDRIKKNNSKHCHVDFIALKEIKKKGGGGTNDTPYMDDLEQGRRALVRWQWSYVFLALTHRYHPLLGFGE